MYSIRKRTISAILATSIFFLAACSVVEDPPPVVEDDPPPQTVENVVPEPVEDSEEVEVNEEIEEIIVPPRSGTELELLIYGFIDEMTGQGFAGTAISVFTRDEIILEFTYGFKNIEEQIPIDNETVFEWASMTKLLTWVSVMQLYERGELDIHADLFTYLPRDEFPNIIYPTSLYHLMRHSAGFSGYWGDFSVHSMNMVSPGSQFAPFTQRIRDLASLSVLVQTSQPGERFFYSSAFGTSLAAYVVQRISGMPFYEYVRYNIFAPLGMQSTALFTDLSYNAWVREQRGRTNTYSTYNSETRPHTMRWYFAFYPAVSATGTISDMMRFARALLLDENGESALFQNPETLLQIYPSFEFIESAETDELAEGIIFRYGFMVFADRNLYSNRNAFRDVSERIIGHTGGAFGRSILWVDIDRGIGMVMSENTEFGLASVEEFYADIAEMILR